MLSRIYRKIFGGVAYDETLTQRRAVLADLQRLQERQAMLAKVTPGLYVNYDGRTHAIWIDLASEVNRLSSRLAHCAQQSTKATGTFGLFDWLKAKIYGKQTRVVYTQDRRNFWETRQQGLNSFREEQRKHEFKLISLAERLMLQAAELYAEPQFRVEKSHLLNQIKGQIGHIRSLFAEGTAERAQMDVFIKLLNRDRETMDKGLDLPDDLAYESGIFTKIAADESQDEDTRNTARYFSAMRGVWSAYFGAQSLRDSLKTPGTGTFALTVPSLNKLYKKGTGHPLAAAWCCRMHLALNQHASLSTAVETGLTFAKDHGHIDADEIRSAYLLRQHENQNVSLSKPTVLSEEDFRRMQTQTGQAATEIMAFVTAMPLHRASLSLLLTTHPDLCEALNLYMSPKNFKSKKQVKQRESSDARIKRITENVMVLYADDDFSKRKGVTDIIAQYDPDFAATLLSALNAQAVIHQQEIAAKQRPAPPVHYPHVQSASTHHADTRMATAQATGEVVKRPDVLMGIMPAKRHFAERFKPWSSKDKSAKPTGQQVTWAEVVGDTKTVDGTNVPVVALSGVAISLDIKPLHVDSHQTPAWMETGQAKLVAEQASQQTQRSSWFSLRAF